VTENPGETLDLPADRLSHRETDMKLLRFGPQGQERPGMVHADGTVRDLSQILADIDGKALSSDMLRVLSQLAPDQLPIASPQRLGPCVAGVGKVVCIGLNYTDHALETQSSPPSEPVIFLKATSSISGPNDDVIMPPNSRRGDWEIELGVVIGSAGVNIPQADAMDHVAGYCIVNDISERSYQLKRGGQWTKGKSYDTFCPIGPWVVTKDEIADPQDLRMQLKYDGTIMQDSSTLKMIFPVKMLVSYISQFMSLHPGDVIATGTPAGIGMVQKPPVFLQDGAELHLSIDGLGTQRQKVVSQAGVPC